MIMEAWIACSRKLISEEEREQISGTKGGFGKASTRTRKLDSVDETDKKNKATKY